jgi:DNA primase
MGCDIRILQIEGAKDPDEYILKYGNVRFNKLVEKALSIIEFKVKLLKQNLNLENVKDKIIFLNEIAKLIAKEDNKIEREIYIENIAKEYDISKQSIYAEVNKLIYKENISESVLEKKKPVVTHKKIDENQISEDVKRRENTIISILLNGDKEVFEIIRQNIKVEDFKYEINKKIAQKVYEELEKGNSNINSIIDNLEEEEQNHITMIMAEDYGIENLEKAIDDIIKTYEKEKINSRRLEILKLLNSDIENDKKMELMKELNSMVKVKKN